MCPGSRLEQFTKASKKIVFFYFHGESKTDVGLRLAHFL